MPLLAAGNLVIGGKNTFSIAKTWLARMALAGCRVCLTGIVPPLRVRCVGAGPCLLTPTNPPLWPGCAACPRLLPQDDLELAVVSMQGEFHRDFTIGWWGLGFLF